MCYKFLTPPPISLLYRIKRIADRDISPLVKEGPLRPAVLLAQRPVAVNPNKLIRWYGGGFRLFLALDAQGTHAAIEPLGSGNSPCCPVNSYYRATFRTSPAHSETAERPRR